MLSMHPKDVRERFNTDGYGHVGPNQIFEPGPERKVHVSRPAIQQNMRHGKKHPTMVVIDEEGNRHFYHAVKCNGYLGFDPEHIDAVVYLFTNERILGFLDPEGDPPFDPSEPTTEKPKTIGDVIWEKLMSFRRKTRRGIYVGWWGFRKYTPVVNCLFDPGEMKEEEEVLVFDVKHTSSRYNRPRC